MASARPASARCHRYDLLSYARLGLPPWQAAARQWDILGYGKVMQEMEEIVKSQHKAVLSPSLGHIPLLHGIHSEAKETRAERTNEPGFGDFLLWDSWEQQIRFLDGIQLGLLGFLWSPIKQFFVKLLHQGSSG
jgi:hypothetical protein